MSSVGARSMMVRCILLQQGFLNVWVGADVGEVFFRNQVFFCYEKHFQNKKNDFRKRFFETCFRKMIFENDFFILKFIFKKHILESSFCKSFFISKNLFRQYVLDDVFWNYGEIWKKNLLLRHSSINDASSATPPIMKTGAYQINSNLILSSLTRAWKSFHIFDGCRKPMLDCKKSSLENLSKPH